MSEAYWYHDKAAESGRRAEHATDQIVCLQHLRDQSNWREIAVGIEKAEAAIKARKAK